jgi:uncharacterized protein (UPF0212 family)
VKESTKQEPSKQLQEPSKQVKEPIIDDDEYMDLPAGKKQCPRGYKSVLHEGVKKCKKTGTKTKTKKVRFVEEKEEDEYVDIPEGKKQCPKGYKAAQHEGRKRCKKTRKNME